MSQVGDLRAALKANLDSIPGFAVYKFAQPNPKPPMIHLWPGEIPNYHVVFGAPPRLSQIQFVIEGAVAFTESIGAQERLDDLLDPEGERSVVAAVESERTLGGLAQDLLVESSTGYVPIITADNRALLTSAWTVTVYL